MASKIIPSKSVRDNENYIHALPQTSPNAQRSSAPSENEIELFLPPKINKKYQNEI